MSLGGSLMDRSAVHVPDSDHNAGPETNYAQLDSKLDVACGLITRAHCLIGREALYHDCALDETWSLTGGSFKIRGGCYFFSHGKVAPCVLTCVTTMEA
jgi:hypothetical protein